MSATKKKKIQRPIRLGNEQMMSSLKKINSQQI